jgi:pyruvate dehydrogenase E2 component (dihydrolipoamide acetyltransferase)
METAKAVVDVPSPYSGWLVKRYGGPGDVVETGHPLADFKLGSGAQRSEAEDTGHGHGGGHVVTASVMPEAARKAVPEADQPTAEAGGSGEAGAEDRAEGTTRATTKPDVDADANSNAEISAQPEAPQADKATVVGAVESSDRVVAERAVAMFGVKAVPAVRALARKLAVDLAKVKPTGPDGTVSLSDVKKAAADGSARIEPPAESNRTPVEDDTPIGRAPEQAGRAPAQPEREPVHIASPLTGRIEPLRGVRRNMARTMAEAHAQVVPTTLFDDADIHAWTPGQDITLRLIRAIVHASRQAPALNAHFDAGKGERSLFDRVDIGLAVDTDDGLFVPAVRDCQVAEPKTLRARIERIREQVRLRQVPPEQLRDYTIMLSNFGMYAGRYATPILVPPCVAILAAGKLRHQATPVMGGIESHRVIPLSLCFDHRACTGGEAARFLAALMHDLALAS